MLPRPAAAEEPGPAEGDPPTTIAAPEAEPAVATEEASESSPSERLQEARNYYERGEFAKAVEAFAGLLDSPVQLRTRQELHEGFLYFAFTLLLQGEPHSTEAAEKLRYALRLDPDYLPSPVTTRPDLLEFYNRQRDAYIAANGPISEPPEIVFPELQEGGTSTRVLRRRWFIPVFGIGLRFLGHRKAANAIMSTEIAALSLNVATLLLRVAVLEDLSPAGFAATEVGRFGNYISFSVFWLAIVVDVVVSLALRRSYELHPERRPANRSGKPEARTTPIRPRLTGSGLMLEFW